jgi:hypothetical protein
MMKGCPHGSQQFKARLISKYTGRTEITDVCAKTKKQAQQKTRDEHGGSNWVGGVFNKNEWARHVWYNNPEVAEIMMKKDKSGIHLYALNEEFPKMERRRYDNLPTGFKKRMQDAVMGIKGDWRL